MTDFNTTTPANTLEIHKIPLSIRELKLALKERLGLDHDLTDTGGTGEHLKVTLQEALATDPTTVAGKGFLYTKDVAGIPELHWINDEGDVIQLTSGNDGDAVLLNNISLRAKNAAGTGTVNLIKVNTSDILELGSTTLSGIRVRATIDFNKEAIANFVVENRTSSPTSPVAGQLWFRTDL